MRIGLVVDGIVGVATAAALDAFVKTPAPLPLDKLIYVDVMYGLGDASTSAGAHVVRHKVKLAPFPLPSL